MNNEQTKTLTQAVNNLEKTVQSTQAASSKDALVKKFTSRKFILSAVGCIAGIVGMITCNDNVIAVTAFIALEALCIISYLITEGKIDAAGVQMMTNLLGQISEMISQLKDGKEAIIPDDPDKIVSDDILPTLPEGEE